MAEVRWIKLAIDVFDNRKIRQIEKMPDGDALVIIWLKLLILAGTVNDGGLVYFTRDLPYTDQLLANQFDRPLATVQLALQVFQQFGMIEITDDIISVSNWQKYQNVDGLERLREQNRERQKRFYDRHRALPDSNVRPNVSLTEPNATEEEKKEEKNRTEKKRFTPPTVDEVRVYCLERGNGIDPERFCDYYEARGWELKPGQKVKDWRACVRTWEKRDSGRSGDRVARSLVSQAEKDRISAFIGKEQL